MKLNGARFALAVLLTSVAANAAVINTYSTQTAFSNASTGLTVIDFTVPQQNVPGGTFTSGSVSVVGTYLGNPQLRIEDPSAFASPNNVNWGYLFASIGTGGFDPDNITVNTAGVTAAALSLATFWTGHQIQITLSTGDIFVVTPNSTAPVTLWGFTSDTAVTSIQIKTTDGGAPMIAHLQVGAILNSGGGGEEPPASETPEAMTMCLLGAGLIAITMAKKKTHGSLTAA